MRLAELEDRLEDLKDYGYAFWQMKRRQEEKRRRALMGPEKLLAQAQAAKAGAEKAL